MKKVQLITDGACIGNPGPGGWACILRYGDRKKEMYGSEPKTTNNRMELTAAVKGLSAPSRRLRSRDRDRFAIHEERHPEMDRKLEAERVANGG